MCIVAEARFWPTSRSVLLLLHLPEFGKLVECFSATLATMWMLYLMLVQLFEYSCSFLLCYHCVPPHHLNLVLGVEIAVVMGVYLFYFFVGMLFLNDWHRFWFSQCMDVLVDWFVFIFPSFDDCIVLIDEASDLFPCVLDFVNDFACCLVLVVCALKYLELPFCLFIWVHKRRIFPIIGVITLITSALIFKSSSSSTPNFLRVAGLSYFQRWLWRVHY